MLNRLFILSFVCFIFSLTFLSYAHSQNLPPKREFDLLCDEVLMGLLSDANGRKILKGQKPLPDWPLDMNLSFIWWESSKIFQWSQGKRENETLWYQKGYQDDPDWKDKDGNVMTFGQKYEEKTVLPDMTRLQNLMTLKIYVLIEKEPRSDISVKPPTSPPIELPTLVWSPDTKWTASTIFNPEKLSKIGVWPHKEKESWWSDALISAAMFGVGYYLRTRPGAEKYFKDEDWKPSAPRCWTACALGEPAYNIPTLPNQKMIPEEWLQNPELSQWYITPRIYERTGVSNRIGDVLLGGSITYAAIVIPCKLFHKKDKFFK